MNAIVPIQQGHALVPHNFTEAVQLADRMAKAKLVPVALQGSSGDCLLVIEQALRWGMSPFAVAQEVSVIQGKLMYSGKIVAAAIQSARGVLEGRLHYAYTGEGDTRIVTVSGQLRGETEPRAVHVRLRDARTQNKVWQTQPDQQLAYHGARVWARRFVPEVMLGVWSPEEFTQAREAFAGTTIEATPDLPEPPLPAPAQPKAAAPRQPTTAEYLGDDLPDWSAAEYPFATAKGGMIYRSSAEWLERWRRLIEACALTGAPDKLKLAAEMNEAQIAAVAGHDAEAARELREALEAALSPAAQADPETAAAEPEPEMALP